MKTAKEFMLKSYFSYNVSKEDQELWYVTSDFAQFDTSVMKQYAVEAINELVDEMLTYPPNELSDSANLIQIANRIKRNIHGVIETKTEDYAG